jgi:phospholipase C
MILAMDPTAPEGRAAGLSRRRFLHLGAAAAGLLVGGEAVTSSLRAAGAHAVGAVGGGHRQEPVNSFTSLTPTQREALAVLGRAEMRRPGSRPDPSQPAGADQMPWVSSIVILMMENHSYDNILGMLGRQRGQRARGDGFRLDRQGRPTATNPYPDGRLQHAFPMPNPCQLSGRPSQEWRDSHTQYAGGRMNGFVISNSGPVAMGYWTGADLPFTYSLASTFPLADRWFSSCLGQTDPNRRYLLAATSAGMTDDIGTGPGGGEADILLAQPAGGTIFNQLDAHGIAWTNYVASYPLGASPLLYPVNDGASEQLGHKAFSQFFTDAAAGQLPSISLLDENYSTQSQEDPQNIVPGEALLAQVVEALFRSPQWRETMLIITYDEHGGYYDHVPPPVALAPDSIPPIVQPGESPYDGFERYGMRVPGLVISPYSKPGYVSHQVYDHTSILATIERKWNLPALTYRDANANDLLGCIDMDAVTARRPHFATLPPLSPPRSSAAALDCKDAGTIPPSGSVSPKP